MNPMDGMLYIANISVDPAVSGQGFGAALIEAAVEHVGRPGSLGSDASYLQGTPMERAVVPPHWFSADAA
jgi:GNAT superfamily N-acetyltransferase